MQSFEGKVAVVTGGGRGIGGAIARALAERGAKVAVISRSESSCGATAEAIHADFPGAAKAYAVDVADHEAVQALGKQVLADFGSVDILVNNAGVTRDGLLMRMKDEDWMAVLDTNLKGAFNTVKAFMRPIMKSDQGRILNIASVIGLMGNAGQANYAASKAGLIGFTKSVARELAGKAVTCNAIAPGFISTDMTDVLPEKVREDIMAKIPLGSFGKVEDVTQLVLFLAGPGARYITGQVMAVDGGMTMQ
ncbi:3-oxoacyl-[acyl-carrier protein] reductase [Haloferula luteola]|uniref:3-oxoacyl-[acyl-carrier-protein] reductase n=1 Tax=Haloferula luteola TaxID=595692 RepID=A0A840V2E9_9BACT|nr:3-oxoacyl-[acyl-carrier-protein] reductase [Haloferula luteola]MBB5352165.1 3-oxoacyl-[acyl-carrier protein] reductase [Haloferula luteola]